ncbi:MAG: class I SAM-dependent methyltransferase [Lachnospiraceae bacterium]|nr:class I SAM-dependent methyltransferase [Lachnospiraceae bacterium]
MFTWSDESIRWYQNASEWTGYHALLAREVSEFLEPGFTVCDVGCGPGCLAVELAASVHRVAAVDVDERVLRCIRQKTAERKIGNVETVLCDYEKLPPNCCDVAVACSFGVMEKNALSFMRLARKRLIVIKRKDPVTEDDLTPDFFNCKYKRYDDEEFLDSYQISYRLYTFDGDFGQPLHDREEALRFLEHYGPDGEELPEKPEKFLKDYEISEPGCEYKYYIPNKKEVHMLVIEKADLMELKACLSARYHR